jgi:hypothetical protein
MQSGRVEKAGRQGSVGMQAVRERKAGKSKLAVRPGQ